MSSILDALKKVEVEKSKQTVDLGDVEEMLAEQEVLVPEETDRQTGKPRLNRVAVAVIAVVVVVLFGAAGFLLHGKLTAVDRAGAADTQPVRSEPPREMSPVIVPPTPVETPPSAETTPVEPPNSVPESAPIEIGAPDVAATAVPDEPAGEEVAAPEPASPTPNDPRPVLRINILRGASEEYPEPLAIVNGKRVTVGDSVDGAKVLKIERDGIVFEHGDDVFRVPF